MCSDLQAVYKEISYLTPLPSNMVWLFLHALKSASKIVENTGEKVSLFNKKRRVFEFF